MLYRLPRLVASPIPHGSSAIVSNCPPMSPAIGRSRQSPGVPPLGLVRPGSGSDHKNATGPKAVCPGENGGEVQRMTTTFNCPECGRPNPYDEDQAGRVLSCRHCGCDIVVPGSDTADHTSDSEWASRDEVSAAPPPRSSLMALLACAVPLVGFGLAQAFC